MVPGLSDQSGRHDRHACCASQLTARRAPVEGLYICGSGVGNGGGMNGAPGYIAANAIVDDLGLTRDWIPVTQPERRD